MRQRYFGPIFVFDRMCEWSVGLEGMDLEEQICECDRNQKNIMPHIDGPIVSSRKEFEALARLSAAVHQSQHSTEVPRRVIWRCGRNPENYADPISLALLMGDCTLVLAESPDWFPSYRRDWPISAIRGYPDLTLGHLWTQGRAHIANAYGEKRPIHLILDSQAPQLVHWQVRSMATHVLVSRVEGGDAYSVLRREFGDGTDDLVNAVRAARQFEWIQARPWRGAGISVAKFRK